VGRVGELLSLGRSTRMDDMPLLFLGVLILVTFVLALLAKQLPSLFRRDAAVRERIRREVHEEFDASIQRSTGLRRWWVIRKRAREISRRVRLIIYGNRAA
jgi:hypothetical protein